MGKDAARLVASSCPSILFFKVLENNIIYNNEPDKKRGEREKERAYAKVVM